jgi:hypothetical protein
MVLDTDEAGPIACDPAPGWELPLQHLEIAVVEEEAWRGPAGGRATKKSPLYLHQASQAATTVGACHGLRSAPATASASRVSIVAGEIRQDSDPAVKPRTRSIFGNNSAATMAPCRA